MCALIIFPGWSSQIPLLRQFIRAQQTCRAKSCCLGQLILLPYSESSHFLWLVESMMTVCALSVNEPQELPNWLLPPESLPRA